MVYRLLSLIKGLFNHKDSTYTNDATETAYVNEASMPIPIDITLSRIHRELSLRGLAEVFYEVPDIKFKDQDGRRLAERLVEILAPLGARLEYRSKGVRVRVPVEEHERYRQFVDSLNGHAKTAVPPA